MKDNYKKAYEVAAKNVDKLSKRLAEEMGIPQCKCACSNSNCFFHLKLCKCGNPGCVRSN